MCSTKLSVLSALAIIIGQVSAIVSFNSTINQEFKFDGFVPTNTVSEKCGAAYSAAVQCSSLLFKLRDSSTGPGLFTNEGLGGVCTTECIDSLNNWDKKIQEDCTDQDKLLADNPTGSLVYLSMALRNTHKVQENLYWAFCLKDSTTGTYCLADDNLPDWPKGSNGTEAVSKTFCKSDCRIQQSYLMYLSYSDSDLADAEAICPTIDTSTFPMNANILGAFGTLASSSPSEGNVGDNTNGEIEGTDFDWEFYVEEPGMASSSNTTYQGSVSASASENSGLRTRFSSGSAFVAVGLVIASALLL